MSPLHTILQSAFGASLLGISLLPAAGQTILVPDVNSNTIQALDVATNFATGLGIPEDLTFGPDGILYVADLFSGSVIKFNGTTGALISTFATGAPDAQGVAFSPLNGNLYVSAPGASPNGINIYNGTTGAFISSITTASGAWGPHFDALGDLFYADPGNAGHACRLQHQPGVQHHQSEYRYIAIRSHFH